LPPQLTVSANNLLFLILATMLATLLVSGFISRLCLAGLELDLLLPEHISAGPCGARQALRAQLEGLDALIFDPTHRRSGSAHQQSSAAGATDGHSHAPVYFPVISWRCSA